MARKWANPLTPDPLPSNNCQMNVQVLLWITAIYNPMLIMCITIFAK
jgi:hypothetical protein